MIDLNSIYVFVGKKIKEKREAAGLSQAKLADAIDVSRASLANYESGNTAIYISYLYLIADHLGADIYEFLPSMQEIRESTSHEKRLENLSNSKKQQILDLIESVEEKAKNG